jgi:hypothetical protein
MNINTWEGSNFRKKSVFRICFGTDPDLDPVLTYQEIHPVRNISRSGSVFKDLAGYIYSRSHNSVDIKFFQYLYK